MSQTDSDGAILTRADGFLQILNRIFLAAKGSALLVMQPAKLLQNLGVIWVSVENPSIRRLCGIVLERGSANNVQFPEGQAYIFLLLVHMPDLEPYVLFGERPGGVGHYVLEALIERQQRISRVILPSYLQTLVVLLLLLVDDTQPKVYLISLLKIRLHAHDLRECLFGVLEGTITVVKYSNAVPKLGLLDRKS